MRVLLAGDHALVRGALRSHLEARGGVVVGATTSGREVVELARRYRPDVVLIDLAMPQLDGPTSIRTIRNELPLARVIVLAASDTEWERARAAESGADASLARTLRPDQLAIALERVLATESTLISTGGGNVPRQGLRPRPPVSNPESPLDALTRREREVLDLLVAGVTSNRALAERLVISENTVKFHLHNILRKLQLRNRAQLVAYTLGRRLTA